LNKDKPYNDGQWTKARYFAFIKGGLRSASQRWPPKYKVLSNSFSGTNINPKSGRLAKHYKCASCKNSFVAKDVEVNHIEPVIPITGFDNWDGVISRLFCEADKLEVLCRDCHKKITKEENTNRRAKKD